MRKNYIFIVAICLTLMSTTGCYFRKEVQANEFGLKMDDGVSVDEVVSAGRYTKMSWYADMKIIDGQAKQFTWSDNDIWTSDKQRIQFEVAVTYSRTKETIELMWEKYHDAAIDDSALMNLVAARIPRVVKAVTSSRTLDSMLGREDLQEALKELLSIELAEIGVTLLDIGVNNIAVDEEYANILSQKAAAAVKAELAKEETKTKQEQLLQEKAQTDIEIELARRENLVAEEKAKVYATSPEMLQLELARIQAEALRYANTVYLPSDTTLNMFNGMGNINNQ